MHGRVPIITIWRKIIEAENIRGALQSEKCKSHAEERGDRTDRYPWGLLGHVGRALRV